MPDFHNKKLKNFVLALSNKRVTTVAGAWVFFFLLAFIPLVFLFIFAFSVLGVDVAGGLSASVPQEFLLLGQAFKETADSASSGITVFFIITVVLSCSSLLSQMSKDGDYIYGARSKKKRGLFRRLWAVLALFVFFILLLSFALILFFRNKLFSILPFSPRNNLYSIILGVALSFFGLFITVLLLNKFISPIKLKLKETLLGAIISVVTILLGTLGFLVYLRFFPINNALYGSLSALIVFIIWLYIIMLSLVIGAVANMCALSKKKNKSLK